MRINSVTNQAQLINASFNTKNKGSQSQMMNNSITKWAPETPRDRPKIFLESFIHNIPAQVMQKATRCTQNAACTTSREATSNSMMVVTARTAFNDKEMHRLRLSCVQSWRIKGFLPVFLGSCSCWVEEIIVGFVCGVGQKDFERACIRSRTRLREENWSQKWENGTVSLKFSIFPYLSDLRLEVVSSLQPLQLSLNAFFRVQAKHGIKR